MKGLRSTIVLLLVLLGLGAYVYFVESKRTPSSEVQEVREKVFTVEGDKIDEIQVKSGAADATTVKKQGTDWQVVAPVQAKADSSEISGITSNLGSLEMNRLVEEAPADLSPYGLATPSVEITFHVAGEKDQKKLRLGSKTATGGDVYASTGASKKVFLISAFLESTFNKSTFDLRDKTMLTFNRDGVDALEITSTTHTIRARKQGTDWALTDPVQAPADSGIVEGLVGRLNDARMKSIEAQSATDLKPYGLDKPSATVTIGAGSSRTVLLLGSKKGDDAVYAKDDSRPLVFTVESTLADELGKEAGEYRRKDLFQFRPFTATRVEFIRGGQTVAFEKVKGSGETPQDKWRQVLPTTVDVDTTKVEDLLSKASGLRALSFPDKGVPASTTAPTLIVKAKFETDKNEQVTFIQSGSDVFAMRPNEPGGARVEATEFTDTIKMLDEALKPAPPAPAPTKP